MQSIGDRIRLARLNKGLSLRQFAKEMKVSYETARSWESPGGTQSRPDKYGRIAAITGARHAFLASGEEPMLPSGKQSRDVRADQFMLDVEGLSPELLRIVGELLSEVKRISRRAPPRRSNPSVRK